MDLLKPKGTIALFWNHPFTSREDDLSNIASRQVYAKHRPSDKKIKEFSEEDCKHRLIELKQAGFVDVEYRINKRIRTLTTEEYIGLLNTYSDHRVLSSDLKMQFEEDMRAAINSIYFFVPP